MVDSKRDKPKVFCIGWHKTGTTTMGEAFLLLGYTVVGARLDFAKKLLNGDTGTVIEEAKKYDAFQDVPWAALFKELDAAYPNSKFILTTRDENKWLISAQKHFNNLNIPLHKWLYGKAVLVGNEMIYLKRYREHNIEVVEYFKDRPNDFLIMSLAKGDSWHKLCSFLNQSIPNKQFPFSNKGKHNYSFKEKIYNKFSSLIPGNWKRKILVALGYPDRRNRFNNHVENTEEIIKMNSK